MILHGGGTKADVQDAVDRVAIGGELILSGIFDFGSETLQVTKAITIRAVQPGDLPHKLPLEDGETPADWTGPPFIMGGGRATGLMADPAAPAFEISASKVTIQQLNFVRPQAIAIRARKGDGLVIRDCTIQELQVPVGLTGGTGIIVGTMPPARIAFGNIQIIGNRIDTLGGGSAGTVGILINQAGLTTGPAAQILVQGNTVKNVTGFGIDFRDLNGSATVVGNTIDTGNSVGQNVTFPAGIRSFGSTNASCAGQYNISKNTITSAIDRAAGIRLYSKFSVAKLDRATASYNQINMSTSSSSPDDRNAGIEVRGFIIGADVSHNTIAGRAGAALSVIEDSGGGPTDVGLRDNHHENFLALIADIAIGAGVSNTQIVVTEGQTGTIQDLDKTTVPQGYQGK